MIVPRTRPYPWPWNGDLDFSRVALLAVGCQRWWVERTVGPDAALAEVATTAGALRDAGGLVVVARHGRPVGIPQRRPALPRPGDPAWDLVLPGEPGDLVVDAAGMDAFFGGPLDADLRSLNRTLLVVCGLGMETAAYSTLTGANDRGYECLLLADATAAHDPAVAERAAASITMSGGIFGAIGTASALVEALAATLTPARP